LNEWEGNIAALEKWGYLPVGLPEELRALYTIRCQYLHSGQITSLEADSPVELVEGRYTIENLGTQNAKVLDALVTCYVDGERFARSRLDDVQGVLIRPQQQISGTFQIAPRLDEFVICTFRVVASDDGERVFRTYVYWSNVHKILVSARRPVRVVMRAWMAPIRLPYFKIVRWTRYSLMRKLIVLAFVLAAVVGLYRAILH
jgi:hypothetical protein